MASTDKQIVHYASDITKQNPAYPQVPTAHIHHFHHHVAGYPPYGFTSPTVAGPITKSTRCATMKPTVQAPKPSKPITMEEKIKISSAMSALAAVTTATKPTSITEGRSLFAKPYESEVYKRVKIQRVSLYSQKVYTPSSSSRSPIFIFLDTEMTQFTDPEAHEILEITIVLTDDAYVEYGRFSSVIKHNLGHIKKLFNSLTEPMHAKSGLLEELEHAQLTYADVDNILCEKLEIVAKKAPFAGGWWTQNYYPAGMSIKNDLNYIQRKLPKFYSMLHYQVLELSSYLLGSRGGMFGPYYIPYVDSNHRSELDVEDSLTMIRDLREYTLSKCSGKTFN